MLNSIINAFESAVGWQYKSPGTNDKQGIDCSGLFVYAFNSINKKIYHGSNRIARVYCHGLSPIKANLELGDVVFKTHTEGKNLPIQYKKGGKYYNKDMPQDFYHIGLVTSLKPLRIVHATPPAVKVDKSASAWSYRARLKAIDEVCPQCGRAL